MADITSILIISTGFVLGLGHSLDPDHVVAVSTLLCKCPNLRKTIASALAWGTGHSVILVAAGLLVLGLRVVIPESITQLFELAAAAMLIALGILVMKPFVTQRLGSHHHVDLKDGPIHVHSLFGHNHSEDHTHDNRQIHKSALTGILQGLAGSAAIMLVTLTTVSSLEQGLIFILVFCLGVISGMICIAYFIGSILNYTAHHLEGVHEKILAITGTISIAFGILIIVQIMLHYHF